MKEEKKENIQITNENDKDEEISEEESEKEQVLVHTSTSPFWEEKKNDSEVEISKEEAKTKKDEINFSSLNKEVLDHGELDKLFELQEKAIQYKETTQKAIMHKMLKQKKFSPNTYQKKKMKLEVWVTKEKEKITKNKNNFKNVYEHTLEMINDTNRNKERIKQVLSKSKSKRPGIWSDYSESLNSFDSSKHQSKASNASMNMNILKDLTSNDQSLHSLIFSGEKNNLNNDSLESSKSGIIDIKKTLQNRLMDLKKSPKEEMKKEIEIDIPTNTENMISPVKENTVELIDTSRTNQGLGIHIITPENKEKSVPVEDSSCQSMNLDLITKIVY